MDFPFSNENSNELISLTSTEEKKVSSMLQDMVEYTGCNPILPGMKYCMINQYSKQFSKAPFFSLNGNSR